MPERALDVSMAKAYASDAATLASRVALQTHGAIGYTWEHDLHLWMKRGWALAAAWGDAAWHRARVGAAVLPVP
jgi:alkylation response protein AidB-like acyl-CoA dehydrogenase